MDIVVIEVFVGILIFAVALAFFCRFVFALSVLSLVYYSITGNVSFTNVLQFLQNVDAPLRPFYKSPNSIAFVSSGYGGRLNELLSMNVKEIASSRYITAGIFGIFNLFVAYAAWVTTVGHYRVACLAVLAVNLILFVFAWQFGRKV